MKDPICGMNVDASSAIKLNVDGEPFYFCSRRCAEKFSNEHRPDIGNLKLSPLVRSGFIGYFRRKWVLLAAGLLFMVALSYIWKPLVPFRMEFLMYFNSVWWAVLLGFFMGGCIDYFIPGQFVSYLLGRNKRSILRAVLCGFLMSACSHGILALSVQLYKKGASVPAVVAFLLASPWANLPLTFILIGFFGPKAFFLILVALAIAIITGLIYRRLEYKGWVESNPNVANMEESVSITKEIQQRWKAGIKTVLRGIFSGAFALADMVMWWMLIGIGLASSAAVYIPKSWFTQYMGPHFGGLVVTLAFATVLEVCSEGTAPLAFEIFRRTGGFGNALVFLLAGVATDYTEIGLLWSNVGRKTALWLPIITVPQIIFFGLLANKLF